MQNWIIFWWFLHKTFLLFVAFRTVKIVIFDFWMVLTIFYRMHILLFLMLYLWLFRSNLVLIIMIYWLFLVIKFIEIMLRMLGYSFWRRLFLWWSKLRMIYFKLLDLFVMLSFYSINLFKIYYLIFRLFTKMVIIGVWWWLWVHL